MDKKVRILERLTYKLKSRIESLSEVGNGVRRLLRNNGVSDELINDVLTSFDEAFANIVFHGYEGSESGNVSVEVRFESNCVMIMLEDEAKGFDFDGVKHRLSKSAVVENPGLGMGIYLMRKLMDKIEYKRIGGKNRLTLEKKIKQ